MQLKCSIQLFTALMSIGCVKATELELGQVSGINQVTFHESAYNKAFAGNGFLIRYQGKVYAVTVKHTLLEAKTPAMQSVHIDGHVSGWQIHPNHQPEKSVVLGKLLNGSEQEKLDMNILQKDWLVFEVKENHSDLTVLTLREDPLSTGDTLTAYGCSYANANGCVQDSYAGRYINLEGNNLRIAMADLELGELRGLSGSPVLDQNNQVVGIVSNVLRSQDGKGFDFAPANLSYLKEVLATL